MFWCGFFELTKNQTQRQPKKTKKNPPKKTNQKTNQKKQNTKPPTNNKQTTPHPAHKQAHTWARASPWRSGMDETSERMHWRILRSSWPEVARRESASSKLPTVWRRSAPALTRRSTQPSERWIIFWFLPSSIPSTKVPSTSSSASRIAGTSVNQPNQSHVCGHTTPPNTNH
jgi:hypothetical protein